MYIINKVLFNRQNELEEKQITIECLEISNKLIDALDYINNLKHISVFCEDIILNNVIHNEPITNKDLDGYYLVVDDENTRKFNIYEKNSTVNKGYIYNSVDIDIKFVGFIEFIEINEFNLNVKKNSLKKNLLEDKKISSDNKIKNKPKRTNMDNKHIYVELNDKMLNELKNKLENLSLKKN